MRKLMNAVIVILICSMAMYGCSKKDKLVGAYMAKNVSSSNEAIVLFKDGTCSYFGDSDTKWKATGDRVTISKQNPDKYYINVNIDNALSDIEKKAVVTYCSRIENVLDGIYYAEGIAQFEIESKKVSDEVMEELSAIKGVTSVEFLTVEGGIYTYEFNVVDNCLVSSNGNVYIKQGT